MMDVEGKRQRPFFVIDLIALAALFLFLLCYFEPSSLLSMTITTGGDTASHYYTAQYLRDYLLPRGEISGWCQGNLAGFPMLQYYFPLPFFIIVLLSWVMPLQIAFKFGTALGTFLLPPAAYLFFRLLKQPRPVPIMGAAFTLPFLFMQGNTMWGGNIPSTLAGEFCYSLGFALSIVWLGLLYRTLSEKTSLLKPALLLALVGLSHGYTLLYAVLASVFFLFTRQDLAQNLKKLFLIYVLALLFMGFWLLPLLAFLPYTTRFSILWIFMDLSQFLREMVPPITRPFIVLSLAGTLIFLVIKRKHETAVPSGPLAYLLFLTGCGFGLYAIGYRLGLVDARFLPYSQFFLITTGAMTFSLARSRQGEKIVLAAILILLTCLWVDSKETFIHKWIQSNYAGFENRPLWKPYQAANRFLQGSPQDPRVVYEHSMVHRRAGTVRAFESLPLFSGRSTLEGLYIQASLSVPFIFYIQSETSKGPSTPIPDYNYSRFNLDRGAAHLRLFNVGDYIVSEAETKERARKDPAFQFQRAFGPYEIYELIENLDRYVVPLRFKPVLVSAGQWKKLSYKWFRLGDLSVPLVCREGDVEEDPTRFHVEGHPDVRHLPRTPIVGDGGHLQETIKEEEVLIQGATAGKPLLIKISFHPNWKVEGADRIYLVSPSFMLIYPEKSRVRLYYGKTWPDLVGISLTALAFMFLVLSRLSVFRGMDRHLSGWFDRFAVKIFLPLILVLASAMAYYLLFVSHEYPAVIYNRGLARFSQGDYQGAREYFREIIERHPQTLLSDQSEFHYAICFFKEEDWQQTIRCLTRLLEHYPETRKASEALYHIGLCYLKTGNKEQARRHFNTLLQDCPEKPWSEAARNRLKEISAHAP